MLGPSVHAGNPKQFQALALDTEAVWRMYQHMEDHYLFLSLLSHLRNSAFKISKQINS